MFAAFSVHTHFSLSLSLYPFLSDPVSLSIPAGDIIRNFPGRLSMTLAVLLPHAVATHFTLYFFHSILFCKFSQCVFNVFFPAVSLPQIRQTFATHTHIAAGVASLVSLLAAATLRQLKEC